MQKDGKRILVLNKKQEKTNETLQIEKGKDISYMLNIFLYTCFLFSGCLCYVYFQHILHVQIQILTGINATCKVETLLLSVCFRNVPLKAFHRHSVGHIAMPALSFTSSYIDKRYVFT